MDAFDAGFDQPYAARIPIVFLDLRDAAELQPGAAQRVLARHPGRHMLLDLTIEVEAQLGVEVAIARTDAEQRPQPDPQFLQHDVAGLRDIEQQPDRGRELAPGVGLRVQLLTAGAGELVGTWPVRLLSDVPQIALIQPRRSSRCSDG